MSCALKKRRKMSCMEAETKKYCCFKRSSLPNTEVSLGYKTLEMFSLSLRSCTDFS